MNFSGKGIWHSVCSAIRAFAVDADRNASSEGGQPISTEAVADLTMIVGAVSVMRRRGSPPPSRCNTAVRVASRVGYRDRGDKMCGSDPMDYVKPADVAKAMAETGLQDPVPLRPGRSVAGIPGRAYRTTWLT